MKKSGSIVLGSLFLIAAASCGQSQKEPEWISGNDEHGQAHDTIVNGNSYRYYNHGWYPISHGLICPAYYSRPYTYSDISAPGFVPVVPSGVSSAHGISTGGFGSSAHASAGE